MKRVVRFSAWIAAMVAIFLIYSALDNIPDVPGMLNSKSSRTLLAQASHHTTHDTAGTGLISTFVPLRVPDAEWSVEAQPAPGVKPIARAIHRAANLPPPPA